MLEPTARRATRAGRLSHRRQVLAFTLLTLIYVVLRITAFARANTRLNGDAAGYFYVSTKSFWSSDFWLGVRPFTVPLIWKPFSYRHLEPLVVTQFVISVLAWLFLAAIAARQFLRASVRVFTFGVILGFALSTSVIMWDRLTLTESAYLSLLAITVALALWLGQAWSWSKFAAFGVALLLWTETRDANMPTLLIIGIAALFGLAIRWFDRRALYIALLVIGVFIATYASSLENERTAYPFALATVMVDRVATYPDRLQWFEDHGMPDGDVLERVVRSNIGPRAHVAVIYSPALANWRAWLRGSGGSTYFEYLLTHPFRTVAEPFSGYRSMLLQSPVSSYEPPDFKAPLAGLATALFTPRSWWIVSAWALAAFAAALALRRTISAPVTIVALALMLSALPTALAAWHAAALEIPRHLLSIDLQFRLGLLLLTCTLVDALMRRRRDVAGPVLRAAANEPHAATGGATGFVVNSPADIASRTPDTIVRPMPGDEDTSTNHWSRPRRRARTIAIVCISIAALTTAAMVASLSGKAGTVALSDNFSDRRFGSLDGQSLAQSPLAGADGEVARWTVPSGAFSNIGGSAVGGTTSGAPNMAVVQAPGPVQSIDARFDPVGDGMGIIFRYRDPQNFWTLVPLSHFSTWNLFLTRHGKTRFVANTSDSTLGVGLDLASDVDVTIRLSPRDIEVFIGKWALPVVVPSGALGHAQGAGIIASVGGNKPPRCTMFSVTAAAAHPKNGGERRLPGRVGHR